MKCKIINTPISQPENFVTEKIERNYVDNVDNVAKNFEIDDAIEATPEKLANSLEIILSLIHI